MSKRPDLRVIDSGPVTPDEVALMTAYRALKDVHRGHVIGMARILAEKYSQERPALTLVKTNPN